jgi:hypothetical protein
MRCAVQRYGFSPYHARDWRNSYQEVLHKAHRYKILFNGTKLKIIIEKLILIGIFFTKKSSLQGVTLCCFPNFY